MEGAIASEPRRSFAIRARPLPDSILLTKKLGVLLVIRGRSALRRILSSLHRLPAVAKGTPTCQKDGNRSITFLLSTVQLCI